MAVFVLKTAIQKSVSLLQANVYEISCLGLAPVVETVLRLKMGCMGEVACREVFLE